MSPVPMCPGCRALLDGEDRVCPYCGWELERTEIRRTGGPLGRALRSFGGVVPVLLFSNILLYVVTALVHARNTRPVGGGDGSGLDLIVSGLLNPGGRTLVDLGANVPEYVLRDRELWRLLCPVFLHGGLLHILFNMSALRSIGGLVEESYGSGKALAIYLVAGIAGNVASIVWFLHTGPLMHGGVHIYVPHIGASGAILGYAGVLAALGFRIGGPRGKALWSPMVKSVGFILVLGIALSFFGSSFQFDNAAHVGGFLFGLAAGSVCTFGARARSSPAGVKAWDAAAVVLVLLTVASFVPPALEFARRAR